jgi:2-iminobutanoate/2-iminopropanoate deaminase
VAVGEAEIVLDARVAGFGLSGPVDPVTGGRNIGPIGEQIRQTLRNMAHMLEWAGSSLDRIVKVTIVLADARDYDDINRVWREFVPPNTPPARSSCALQLSKGNGVEIECVALAGAAPAAGAELGGTGAGPHPAVDIQKSAISAQPGAGIGVGVWTQTNGCGRLP